MAHGWDSYYDNISPDPSTLRRTPESEESFSQEIENFIEHHDFTSTVASHDPPATSSNFDANCYSNTGVGNSSSECVYQRYYTESQWQADGQQIEKDYLPQCENSDVSDFATDGLLPSEFLPTSFATDLQGIKQDCGTLTASFLEDYSDVSSCLETDAGEARPSCKFMTNNTVQKLKNDATTKHSLTQWMFSHTENTVYPTESLPTNMQHIDVGLQNASNVTTSECLQDKNPTEHDLSSTASNMMTTTGSDTVEEMERDLAHRKPSDILSDHRNLTDDGNNCPVTNEKEQTNVSNVLPTFHNEQKHSNEPVLAKKTEESFNEEKRGSDNCSTNSVRVKSMTDDHQDKMKALKGKEKELGPENALDDQKLFIDDKDEPMETDCEKKDIKPVASLSSGPLGFKHASTLKNNSTLMSYPDLNDADGGNKESHLNSFRTNVNTNPGSTEHTNSTFPNTDCSDSADFNKKVSTNVSDKNRKYVADHPEFVLQTGKEVQETTGSTNLLCSDLQCSVVIGGKNEQNVFSHVATHLQPKSSNTDTGCCLESKTTSFSADSNSSDGVSIDNSVKKKKRIADDADLVLRKDRQSSETHPSLEKDCTSTEEKIMALSPKPRASDSDEQSCVESCLELSNSKIHPYLENEMKNLQELETAALMADNSTRKLLDQNLVELKPLQPYVDDTENARESFEDLDTSREEQSLVDMLYGEPLSREDSTCETDEASHDASEYKETFKPKITRNNTRGQAPETEASRQMTILFQPVVILKSLESLNEISNPYVCASCKHTTNSVANLIEHHHCSHSVHNFQFCKTCNVYLMRNAEAKKHVCVVNKERLRCSNDSSPAKTRRHGRHKCNRCGLIFSKVVLYIRHMRAHTGKTPFRCNKCGVYFAQGCTLQRHKRITGRCKESKPPDATLDSVTTKIKTPPRKDSILNRQCPNLPKCYVKLVDISKTNICRFCGKSFLTEEKTKNHVHSVHKRKSREVSPNGFGATKPIAEKTSKEENETRSKYKCPLCPRLFKYSYNRARHLRDCVRASIYGGKDKVAGKYRCPLCHTTFTLSSNRYRHIKAFCLRKCLNRLAKQRAKAMKKEDEKKSKEAPQRIQPKENEQKEQAPLAGSHSKTGQRYKCNLCPATFSYPSGKYRHMKKHELFKLTGKMFRYRNTVFSTVSKPVHISSISKIDKDEVEDTSSHLKLSCHFCGKCFSTSQSLKKHERNHRGERPYRCLECRKGFKKHCHLVGHKIVHQRRIQCTVCRKILPTIGELIQHRTSHNKRGMLQCPDCEQQFRYPAFLLRHLRSHRKRKIELPQLEERSPIKPQQSLDSIKEHSGQQLQLQCSLCKEVFDNAQVLRTHCLAHISRSSSHQCPFCKHNFSTRRYLLRHMIKHTGDKSYSCKNCGKQFFRDLYLKLHSERCFPPQITHEVKKEIGTKTKRPYRCSICPRSFCKKMRLKNHLHAHKVNSLLLCSRCGQYFGIQKFNQHQKTCVGTTGPIDIPCDENLNKSTSQAHQNIQKMPLQSNTSMLQFKCPHCPQRFRYRSILLRHMVSHTGVQPYPCMHCGHRFPSRGMCLQHEAFCDGVYKEGSSKVNRDSSTKHASIRETAQMPQAKGEAEFKCKFCTKTFLKSRNLRHHILTHNEVNPYRCKTCDSCFSRYDHLKVHQSRCKGRKTWLEVCIPKISLDDVGRGWQNRFGNEPAKKEETFECKLCQRSFSTESNLSRHNTMFHVAKAFKCILCGSSFSHENALKMHRKMNKCTRVLSEADVTSPQEPSPKENLTMPLRDVKSRILQRIKPFFNKKYKHVCSYCPRVFRNSWQLNVHTRLHTGEKPYACDYCDLRFIRKDYVQRHYAKCTKKRPQNQVLCDRCGGFFSKDELENHKKHCTTSPNTSKPTVCHGQQSGSQAPPKGFSCAYCNSCFLLFSQLQEHFLYAHKLETVSPPTATASLQQHLSNIPNIKEEPLDESCDDRRGKDAKLNPNLDTASNSHVTKPFICPVCKMCFANKPALISHLRGHSMKYPFICKTCKKGFWNKTLLRNHQRKCRLGQTLTSNEFKTVEVPLKAEIDFALNDLSKTSGTAVLHTHFSCQDDLRAKSPENSQEAVVLSNLSKEKKTVQYQCSECDESFTDGLLLISHLEDHGRQEQEKKRNTCPKCGRVCASQFHLQKHMKIHGMEKNYPCPDCSMVVYTISDLERHRTCHDSNRPFVCRFCHQRFWKRPSLCNHYNENHPDKVYSCRFCNKTYSVKKSLQRHYKKWHQKEQNDLRSAIQERGSTEQQSTSQVTTAGESDEDGKNGSEDSNSDSAPYFPCHVCGKTFPASESLEDHQRCHLGEKPHECEECGKCFFQASQLQQHQRMHKSEFQCQICGRGFVSLFALRKHKHTHGKNRPYSCSKCHLSFTAPSLLAEHMSTHREENFPCDICNRVFHSKSTRAEHRKSHSQLGNPDMHSVSGTELLKSPNYPESSLGFSKGLKYRCGVCSDRFGDPEQLSEHGCKAAKERLYTCVHCDKHFLHASHLKKHRNTHHLSWSSNEYQCNNCNNSFPSSQHFLYHLKNHADTTGGIKLKMENKDEEPSHGFICPVCYQCFASATELYSHFSMHPDPIYRCKICKITFSSKSKLIEHEQQHLTSSTEFQCSESSQKRANEKVHQSANVPTASYLAAEEEEIDVTGEDLYHCPLCSMQFSSKSLFLEHQNKVHLSEKPFKCELCGKAFALRRYLKEHERRHRVKLVSENASQSPEKLFRCTQCNAQLKTEQDLSVHMRMHAEKEVGHFRCDMCYKSFSQWQLLKLHQESHVGEVVYECTECEKAFAFPHLLEEHQQTHAGSSH